MVKVQTSISNDTWEAPALGGKAHFENIGGPAVPRAHSTVLGTGAIVGSYRIVGQVGCGSMGMVYEAVPMDGGPAVAIKVLHAALLTHSGMTTRLLQEAAILEQLEHPGVTEVFESGLLDDQRPWIAMELVTGESLGSKLSRVGTLAPIEVCNLIAAIADVLATAHSHGIVHRDLKPENVLFAEAVTGFPLRVIDWGVARVGPVARLTLDGVTCGTPIYMSPEQMRACDIAPPCDIYSLGVIAYEAVCGAMPFNGRTLADIAARHLDGDAVLLSDRTPTTPRKLCELVHMMLAKLPDDRPLAFVVRQLAQLLALEISHNEFESYSVTRTPWPVMSTRPIDHGSSDHPPASTVSIRRPRWTPETSYAVAGEITPLAAVLQVST